jgi:hypothetical protein
VTPSHPDQPDNHPDNFAERKKKAEAFFAGEMSAGDQAAFEQELVDNPELARDIYDAMGMGPVFHEAIQALRIRRLESHARIADRSVSKQVPWWGRTRSRLAVTVVVAALVFLVVFVSNIGEVPTERTPADQPPVAGVRGMSPTGGIDALPVQFTWPPHPTATQYQFEIYDDVSQPVYSTLTSGTTLIVAVDDLSTKGFRSGFWRVVPLDRHGAELVPSEPVPIRVKRP